MALSASTSLTLRNMQGKAIRSKVVLTGQVMYKHALAAATAAGLAKIPANAPTLRFIGLVVAQVDTGDGTVEVETITGVEALLPMQTGVTVGHEWLTKIYCVDDETGTIKTTLGPQIGIMTEYVSANSAWILLGANPLSAAS